MDRKEVDEIIACLPQGRSVFHYFKDYYALQLLGWATGDGVSLEQLRRGPFASLLSKPVVRPLLAACGDGRLDAARASGHWVEPSLPFLLTLGRWQGGGWRQTSRPGWNLVLRLNFNRTHDEQYRRRFLPDTRYRSLNYSGHPVMAQGERDYYRETLAWARLDLDLAAGEALIEEIQTDWVRRAQAEARRLARCGTCPSAGTCPQCPGRQASLDYFERTLPPYAALWDQAMLSAALFFLVEEIGVRRIWYHHWETGNLLKGLERGGQPPRSIYTQLPRRFCFRETPEIPALLQNRRTRRLLRGSAIEPRFHRLDI
jgi:hypothetical protein